VGGWEGRGRRRRRRRRRQRRRDRNDVRRCESISAISGTFVGDELRVNFSRKMILDDSSFPV
jgi:hypothetical protein